MDNRGLPEPTSYQGWLERLAMEWANTSPVRAQIAEGVKKILDDRKTPILHGGEVTTKITPLITAAAVTNIATAAEMFAICLSIAALFIADMKSTA